MKKTLPKHQKQRNKLFARWNNRCYYCGRVVYTRASKPNGRIESSTRATVDHRRPRARGGGHFNNRVPACAVCNNDKAYRTLREYLAHVRNKLNDPTHLFPGQLHEARRFIQRRHSGQKLSKGDALIMTDSIDAIKRLVATPEFQRLIENAEDERMARMSKDPTYTTKRYIHLNDLLIGFATGALDSYAWHKPYQMPPFYQVTLQMFTNFIQRRYDDEVVHLTFLEVETLYSEFISGCDEVKYWNNINNDDNEPVVIITSSDEVPSKPQLVGMMALRQNCLTIVIDRVLKNEASDARIAASSKDYTTK